MFVLEINAQKGATEATVADPTNSRMFKDAVCTHMQNVQRLLYVP